MRCAYTILHYHLSPVWLYHIFPHYLINHTIFGEKVIEHKMCVLTLSTIFVQNISNSKKNSAIHCHKCTHISLLSTCYFCLILITLEPSQQIFKNSPNIKFHENLPNASQVVPCSRQTDRQDKDNSRFSQFCKCA